MITKPAEPCPKLCGWGYQAHGNSNERSNFILASGQRASCHSTFQTPKRMVKYVTVDSSWPAPEVMVNYIRGSFSSKTESGIGKEVGTKHAFLSQLGNAYQNSFSYQVSTKCLEMTFPKRGNGPAVLFLAFSHPLNRKNINQWKNAPRLLI